MGIDDLNAKLVGRMPGTLGIRFVSADKARIVAILPLRSELMNLADVVHGGTLMAFADTCGAAGAIVNLPPNARTATIESKTNFLAAARTGPLRAESTPLHIGATTMVWQTRVTDPAGKLVSMTTQTQIVMPASEQGKS